MSAGSEGLQPWDGHDLFALLTLEAIDPSHFRSRYASENARGSVFGGQLLGHAVMAASMTVPPDRDVTAMQLFFSQSAIPDRPIDFEVTAIQEGKRFSSRHVRGTQSGGRLVLDAQVMFALPLLGPQHATAAPAIGVDPNTLMRLDELPIEISDAVWQTLGYPFDSSALDLRLADPAQGLGLDAHSTRLRFWLRARNELPDNSNVQAAAFAYLSDWWLNFSTVGIHVRQMQHDGTRLHVASLNHSIWFHRPLLADRWLHFDIQSPCAASGRGLSIATVHDVEGVLVASATQENLMTPLGST